MLNKFHITCMPKMKPLFIRTCKGLAIGNQNQNVNQPNLHQCGNQQSQLINNPFLRPAQPHTADPLGTNMSANTTHGKTSMPASIS